MGVRKQLSILKELVTDTKMFKTFKKLSLIEKSNLLTSWIQTLAIVLGIIFGLLQLNNVFNNSRLTEIDRTYKEIEKYKKNTEKAYAYLLNYYKELYPFHTPEDPESYYSQIKKKYSSDDLNSKMDLLLSEIDRLITLSNAGIINKEITNQTLTFGLTTLIAQINDKEEYPGIKDQISIPLIRIEERFYKVAPFFKALYYNRTGGV